MKKLINLLLVTACLASTPVFTGCKSAKPETREAVAFHSLETTYNVAKAAYEGVVTMWLKKEVSNAKMTEVDQAWNAFRAGYEVAVRASLHEVYPNTPESLLKLSDALFAVIRTP